jgi:hypothetical protein
MNRVPIKVGSSGAPALLSTARQLWSIIIAVVTALHHG